MVQLLSCFMLHVSLFLGHLCATILIVQMETKGPGYKNEEACFSQIWLFLLSLLLFVGCGHCKKTKPEFETAAEEVNAQEVCTVDGWSLTLSFILYSIYSMYTKSKIKIFRCRWLLFFFQRRFIIFKRDLVKWLLLIAHKKKSFVRNMVSLVIQLVRFWLVCCSVLN